MSKRWLRETGCEGKKRFESKGQATDSANCIRRHTGDRMHAYFCTFCRYWHIGHRGSMRPKRLTPHYIEERNARRSREDTYCAV